MDGNFLKRSSLHIAVCTAVRYSGIVPDRKGNGGCSYSGWNGAEDEIRAVHIKNKKGRS